MKTRYTALTGHYDLSLKPCVLENVTSVDPCESEKYKRLVALYHGPTIRNASCLRQLVEMDAWLRMNREEPNYSLYPDMGDVQALVQAIRSGKQVETKPTNDPTLGIVQLPRNVCNATASAYSQDLIVLIKTCVACARQREHARQTYMQPKLWPHFNVQFVFVVGLPASNDSEWVELGGARLRNPNKGANRNLSPIAQKEVLFNESKNYGDLLIGDHTDTYYNLTLKLVTTFRWVSAFCRHTAAVYMFLDNDYSLIPNNTMKMIRNIPQQLRLHLNGGTFGPDRTVLRPANGIVFERWSVSENEIPWNAYPQYSSGAGYIIGAELVTDASIAMAYTRFLRFDDVYLGFVWNKLNVPIVTMPQMRHTVIGLTDASGVASLLTRETDALMDWNTGIMIRNKLNKSD